MPAKKSFILDRLADGLGRISPKAAERLSIILAAFCWMVLRQRRKVVLANMHIAASGGLKFPLGIRASARLAFDHMAMTAVEFMRGQRYPWVDGVELAGREHIDVALAEGRGVFILCAHHGNWEVCGAALSRLVRPAHILVKPIGSPRVNQFVLEIRRLNGFRDIDRTRKGDGVRAILRGLAANEMVAFVLDQTRPGEPRLPFFGAPAQTNTGLAALWRRHRAPIVPCWIERLSFGKHRLHFRAALKIEEGLVLEKSATLIPKADIMEVTSLFNLEIESMIRQKPEQYFWMHRRWK